MPVGNAQNHVVPAIRELVERAEQLGRALDENSPAISEPNMILPTMTLRNMQNQAQAEIRRNAGNGNEEIVAPPVPEVARIDRNRFRPANANEKHAQRTDQVKVRLWVQGEPPHHLRRRSPQRYAT